MVCVPMNNTLIFLSVHKWVILFVSALNFLVTFSYHNAQRDSEKDQKCSKLEDDIYDMQKKMVASSNNYEQQEKSKYRTKQCLRYNFVCIIVMSIRPS